MGLRSFIGRIKRKKRENGGSDDEEVDDHDYDESSAHDSIDGSRAEDDDDASEVNGLKSNGDGWKPSMSPDSRPPVRMGEDPSSKEINVFSLDRAESVQERINRVKSGKMTDEEKQAYLRAALSSGSTPESRLPLRPPKSKAEQESMERHNKASPFPGDPIYRSIAGGKKDPLTGLLSNDLVDRVGLDMQKRKRDYLDMVTDPHRFDVYRSAAGSKLGRSAGPADNLVNGNESTSELPKLAIDPLPTDLGERLGAAANAQEVSRRQAEEEKRLKEKERIDALNRRVGDKRAKIFPRSKDNPANQRLEQEKMQELMKAQDDYWSRKLASEREAKERQARMDNPKYSYMGGGASHRAPTKTPPKETVDSSEAPTEASVTPNGEKQETDAGSNSSFNPDESSLLDDVSDERPRGAATAAKSRYQPLQASDLNDVRTLNRPVSSGSRQPRKKDNFDDDQIRRLRELNSPLPNRTPLSKGVRPQPSTRASFEPQRPISASSSSATHRSSLNNLMRNNLNDSQNPAAKTRELLNGYSGKSDAASTRTANGRTSFNPQSAQGKSKSDTAPAAANNNPIAMMFGSPAATPPARETKPQPSSNDQPRRKGPIRMQLPLGDEEDDEEDGLDAGANSGMSIAEAMKRATKGGNGAGQDERSKKWGVDMSRFM